MRRVSGHWCSEVGRVGAVVIGVVSVTVGVEVGVVVIDNSVIVGGIMGW